MSIISRIQLLVGAHELWPYEPMRTTRRAQRRLFLTNRIRQLLNDSSSAVNMLVGRGEIEAALTAWTVGDHIHGNGRGGPGFGPGATSA